MPFLFSADLSLQGDAVFIRVMLMTFVSEESFYKLLERFFTTFRMTACGAERRMTTGDAHKSGRDINRRDRGGRPCLPANLH